MTILPRAATAGELTSIRTDNQSTRLYLTVHSPATIYTARLAAVPSSTDSVVSITYNTGSGTHTDIIADMTMLVGTSAGASDLGQVRIRTTTGIGATSGTFYINETSEIAWAANAYLTVLDEFAPWRRDLRTVGTTVYMDYDIAYSDQHSHCDSIPVLGPAYVAWLKGSTVSIQPDASQSWSLNNTITAYAWTATGASSTADMTTATPTITYDTAGTYRISCEITNDDGKAFTGYRYVFIVSESAPPLTSFNLESLGGDYESGGYTARITMYDDCDLSTIRDRAMVILHARDWYGTTEESIGYVAGCENILFVGWIDGESINWQTEYKPGTVTFEAHTVDWFLNRMTAFPTGLRDVNSTPVKWTKFQGLTAKVVWWHILHWRTTVTRCADVFECTNQLRAARMEAPGAQSIWTQLNVILDQAILGKATCDRYGRLFAQLEQNLVPEADRSTIAEVMTITSADWLEDIQIDRTIVPDLGIFDLSGVSFNGTTASPFFSLAPGHVFKRQGAAEQRERLVLNDQADTNDLAGLYLGWKNNNYKRIVIKLGNVRLMDIAPYQYCILNITAADTVRGITASSMRLIPRSIQYSHQSGFILSTIEFEAETFADLSITDTRPVVLDPPIEPPPPPPPPPIITPGLPSDATEIWMMHFKTSSGYVITWSTVADGFVFGSESDSASWNKIDSWPTGFNSASDETARMAMTIDGSQLYIFRNNTVWQCTNLSAIRTAPATTPTWSVIAAVGDSVLGLTLERVGSITGHSMRMVATGQVGPSSRQLIYGEYNGSAWTWNGFVSTSGLGTAATPYCTYQRSNIFAGASINLQRVYNTSTDALLHEFTWAASSAISTQMWRNNSSGTTYVATRPTPYTTIRIATADTGTLLYDTGVTDNQVYAIRGAFNGSRVYVTTRDGGFHYSTDGIAFDYHSTWSDSGSSDRSGQVQDSKRVGNGPLVWAIGNANAGEVVRVSIQGLTGSFVNKTGNFWTVLSTASAVKLRGYQLVFR